MCPDGTPLRLKTERLELTPLGASDTEKLHTLWTTPQVREFLWDGRIISPDQTLAIVTESSRLFAAHGFGIWGAHLSRNDALAGFGGLWYFRDPPELELLYGVAVEHWRKGLANEAAGAIVSNAFQVLGHEVIRASTDSRNRASVRDLAKLEFVFERHAIVEGRDTLFYRLIKAAPSHPPSGGGSTAVP